MGRTIVVVRAVLGGNFVLGVSIIEHTFGARLLTSDGDCESDICRNSGEESESGESCRGMHVESDD
jgi:hypothetical protein